MVHDLSQLLSKPCTAFEGHDLLLSGPLVEVALGVKAASESSASNPILVFDDGTGRVIDLDLRGSKADVIGRLSKLQDKPAGRGARRGDAVRSSSEEVAAEPRGKGRPRLGVVAREVTLLPRQWEWLATQPGGASAVLRRLVDEARKNGGDARKSRAAQEAAYHFMSAMAGDFVDYEEATRALFAGDHEKLGQCMSTWPEHIRAYALRLANPEAVGG